MLLWLVALRYGAFTRKAQRAYQDGLAETNEVLLLLLAASCLLSRWCITQGVLSTCCTIPGEFIVSVLWHAQVAQESLGLSRVVRAFGTEERESNRYIRCLGMLRRISVRQATAYLLYLVTNASLFNLTKVQPSVQLSWSMLPL